MNSGSSIKRFIVPAAIVIYALIAAMGVSAFSFSPMTVSIGTSGADAVITYKVTNESDKQTAVSIKVLTRTIDAQGVETNESADKLFLVFPSRIVLKPNSSQNIKVQYRGNAKVPAELSFRVVAEQLPVDFSKATNSGVNILLTYVAALYVTPKNAAPNLVLAEAVGVKKDGKQGLQIKVKNTGTAHALVSNPKITINQGGGAAAVEFSGEAASGIDGQNLLANSERIIFVPWDAAVTGTTYSGSVSVEME